MISVACGRTHDLALLRVQFQDAIEIREFDRLYPIGGEHNKGGSARFQPQVGFNETVPGPVEVQGCYAA